MEQGFRRPPRRFAEPDESTSFKVTFRRSASPSRERKRSGGPLPALRRRSPEALAGGRWLGGRIVERVSAEADEAVVVDGDGPDVQGGLDGLRGVRLDVDRVAVLGFVVV